MRERGVQSRRAKAGPVDPARRPAPPSRGGGNFWQALAIVALIAATAGWTTVAVLALRPSGTAVATDTADSSEPPDASEPPDVPSHDVPDLEAFLPTAMNGTTLDVQSVTGDGLLTGGDEWSNAITTFLTSVAKLPADLGFAYASDPSGSVDINIGVYRVPGVEAAPLRDALIEGWKALSPTVKVSQVTLGGKQVTKGDDGTDSPLTYLYARDNVVYEIYTSDESVATAALAALPVPGAPAASHSPAASTAPSGNPAASAAPSN